MRHPPRAARRYGPLVGGIALGALGFLVGGAGGASAATAVRGSGSRWLAAVLLAGFLPLCLRSGAAAGAGVAGLVVGSVCGLLAGRSLWLRRARRRAEAMDRSPFG